MNAPFALRNLRVRQTAPFDVPTHQIFDDERKVAPRFTRSSAMQEVARRSTSRLFSHSDPAFPGATHEYDVFDGEREFSDPRANRRHGGVVHVRPDPQAREQTRDDLVQFFSNAFAQSRATQEGAPK